MNSEEFKGKKKQIQHSIFELKKELNQIEKDYIEENKKFSIGETVTVTYTNGKKVSGIVCNIGVFDDGELFYPMKKFKVNGKPSSHRLYHDSNDILKIEKTTIEKDIVKP